MSAYILIIMAVMYHACMGPDTYYYWQWTRHLAWSYYDGPPMIAYALRVMTAAFGDGTLGLLSLGMLTVAVTSYLAYQIAKSLFESEKAAYYTVLTWLLAAVSLRHFFLLITYDTTLIIFWALTFYFFVQLLQTQRIRYYYWCGISMGLMLLSKYTAVLLCGSLFLTCCIYRDYRFVLKNKHFYAALGIALLLFMPVIYWNYQHDWMSFSYQLGKGLQSTAMHFDGLKLYLKASLINFNGFFAVMGFLMLRFGVSIFKNPKLGLIAIPALFVWLFFCLVSLKNMPWNGDSWNSESFFTAALLIGFYLSKPSVKKSWVCAIFIIAGLCSATYLVVSRFPALNPVGGWGRVYAAKKMLSHVPKALYQNKVIYHNGHYWGSSFISYFLPGQPEVYSTNIKHFANQYYLWNQQVRPAKTGDTVLVFSFSKQISHQHFKQCGLKQHLSYLQTSITKNNYCWNLYIYACRYQQHGTE